jgi:hypothetical protein
MKAIYGSLICLFLLAQGNAHANQTDSTGKGTKKGNVEYSWKIEAGESMTNMSVSDLTPRTTLSPRLGLIAGVSFVADDFRTGRLTIGTHYQQAGVKVTTKDVDEDASSISLHYLRISAQYHFYIGRSKRLFAGGGGYIAPLLSHRSEQISLNFEKIKNHDAGAMATVGYRLSPRIILEGGVQKGFVNIDVSEERRSARNGMAFLSLGFSLGSSTSGHIKKAKLFCRKQGGDGQY